MERDNIIPLRGAADSIASKLLTAANFWRRSGNAYYRKHFRLSITDVRILTLIEARGPISLNALATHFGIDKTQASRAVTELVRRKLVIHNKSTRIGPVGLLLDRKGAVMLHKLRPAIETRLKVLAGSASQRELELIDQVLSRLVDNARSSLKPRRAGGHSRRAVSS